MAERLPGAGFLAAAGRNRTLDRALLLPAWFASAHETGKGEGAEIGHAVGTSPDDAQLRFDPETPIADSRWPLEH